MINSIFDLELPKPEKLIEVYLLARQRQSKERKWQRARCHDPEVIGSR